MRGGGGGGGQGDIGRLRKTTKISRDQAADYPAQRSSVPTLH